YDARRADVDPRTGRHLAVHHQALPIELVEVLPGGPVRHQVGVGDQHARGVGMGGEDADRLAGLDQQGLVVAQGLERLDDRVVALPVARGAADAAVDHQLRGVLGHFRVQVVLEHAERGLGEPGPAGQLGAPWGADRARGVVPCGHCVAVLREQPGPPLCSGMTSDTFGLAGAARGWGHSHRTEPTPMARSAAFLALLLAAPAFAADAPATPPLPYTLPATMEHHRFFVEATTADGQVLQLFTDSGGGMNLTTGGADKLGLAYTVPEHPEREPAGTAPWPDYAGAWIPLPAGAEGDGFELPI